MYERKKWSQDLKYKNNVSIKEKQEKIQVILTTSLISTLPHINTPPNKMSYNNSPLKNNYSYIQNYSPFLSRVTKGKSVK